MTVVGVGVTLHKAVEAYEQLKAEGIYIRVIDPFTLKPIDKELLVSSAKATGGRVITVEDHYPEGVFFCVCTVTERGKLDLFDLYVGGLGEAVASALTDEPIQVVQRKLAVREVPRSGPGEVLMDMYNISTRSIVEAVKQLIA